MASKFNVMAKRNYLSDGWRGRIRRKGADMLEAFLGRVFIWMTNQRWAQRHPWFNPAKSDTRWLPINADIEMPDNCPLPVTMLDQMIEEASHRVIIDFCGCRNGFLCEDYPIDIGCLFLGDDAVKLKVYPWREVTVDEAKQHVRRAVDAGLIPGVGKARVDNWLFKIPDRSRLLSICFCCDCCCLGRYVHSGPIEVVEGITSKLPGISMEITDDCIDCDICVERCYIGAVKVVDGKYVFSENCRACGRCALACPVDAIKVRIDDPDFVEKTRARIRSYVNYE
jgi:ferredoxin